MATALKHPVRFSAADRRTQILRVAAGLFARQGFRGTTTRQISDAARVNESLIFRHFRTKEELYWNIIEQECRPARMREVRSRLRASVDDFQAFSGIAEEMLRRHGEDTTLSRLLLFSALENHRLSERFFRTHIADYYDALAEHIRGRIAERRFRPVDPLLAARGFLGMVVYHSLVQELFGGKRYQQFDIAEVSRALTDVWLNGMQAGGAPAPVRRNGARASANGVARPRGGQPRGRPSAARARKSGKR